MSKQEVNIYVWEMTLRELEDEAKKREGTDPEYASELRQYAEVRRERCLVCKATWRYLALDDHAAQAAHIGRCEVWIEEVHRKIGAVYVGLQKLHGRNPAKDEGIVFERLAGGLRR